MSSFCRRLACACVLLAAAAAAAAEPAPASAATKTYSTGPIHQAIPDGGVVEQGLRVRDKGPVSHVSVSLRIDHPQAGQLTLELVSPSGQAVLLSAKRGGTGANYGKGPGCDGQLTVFDDEFGTPIAQGSAPFLDSPYTPEQKLAAIARSSATTAASSAGGATRATGSPTSITTGAPSSRLPTTGSRTCSPPMPSRPSRRGSGTTTTAGSSTSPGGSPA